MSTHGRGGGAGSLRHRARAVEGMVTAELAVGMLGFVPFAAAMIALAGLASTQVKVVEASRAAARSAARGDPLAVWRAEAARILPRASIEAVRDGDLVTVRVSTPVGGAGLLPSFTMSASATSVLEVPGGAP